MSHNFSEYTSEVIIGAFTAIASFFGKRTLSNYDRRILKTEDKQDEILEALHKIDKKVVAIDTKLNSHSDGMQNRRK